MQGSTLSRLPLFRYWGSSVATLPRPGCGAFPGSLRNCHGGLRDHGAGNHHHPAGDGGNQGKHNYGGLTTLALAAERDVTTGDTLAVGVGPATPYGLLGRVTRVSSDGESVTVDTDTTSVMDAVHSGDIDVSVPLGADDIVNRPGYTRPWNVRNDGTPAMAHPRRSVLQQLQKNLSCDRPGVTAELSGTFDPEPTLSMSASWRLLKGSNLPKSRRRSTRSPPSRCGLTRTDRAS